MPDPAGALMTETRLPSVRTDSAAAAWSSRSPVCVRCASVSCAWPVSAASSRAGSVPSARAACVRVRRGAPLAPACVSMRLPWPAACGWHTGCRRGAGRRCVRRRAASYAGLRRLGCFQADDRLELRAQGAVGQVFEQRGGRGGVHSRPRQDPAEVLDHIRAGPGALFLLRERDRLLRRVGHLSSVGTVPVAPRGCAAARPVLPCHTDGATEARLTPSVRASLSAQPACACATSSVPCLALRVLKLEACARCAVRVGRVCVRTAARIAWRGRAGRR